MLFSGGIFTGVDSRLNTFTGWQLIRGRLICRRTGNQKIRNYGFGMCQMKPGQSAGILLAASRPAISPPMKHSDKFPPAIYKKPHIDPHSPAP